MAKKQTEVERLMASQRAKHAARMKRYRDRLKEPHDLSTKVGGEMEPLRNVVLRELLPHGICCICGNHGIIDTRGLWRTVEGVDRGAKTYCICPNGRALKRLKAPL